MKKRILSIITALTLCASMLPTYALAEEIPDTGLCEHHSQHTADCGYTEAKRELPAAMSVRYVIRQVSQMTVKPTGVPHRIKKNKTAT
ncbi:MAG: hypothetical protein ACLSEX_01105 [Blautia sp.]